MIVSLMNKKIKRYAIDVIFSYLYGSTFYSLMGLLFWTWTVEQTILYISTNWMIALFSGRLYGYLLNEWRKIMGEGKQ